MNLADMFYLCVLMMGYGPVFVRATIHGIVINTVQSLASLPEVMGNGTSLGTDCLMCSVCKIVSWSLLGREGEGGREGWMDRRANL